MHPRDVVTAFTAVKRACLHSLVRDPSNSWPSPDVVLTCPFSSNRQGQAAMPFQVTFGTEAGQVMSI